MIASEICALFGGGGHPYAAGCELGPDLEDAKKKLLAATGDALKKYGLVDA